MVVQCEKCGKVYDDTNRWTICPHRSLDGAARTPQEREADNLTRLGCTNEVAVVRRRVFWKRILLGAGIAALVIAAVWAISLLTASTSS